MKVALLYDFDKTLSRKDMQEYGFIESLGIDDAKDFWKMVRKTVVEENMDSVLAYMFEMVNQAKNSGRPITQASLASYGTRIDFYPGVDEWFSLVNAIGAESNIEVEHYIVSSGLKEIIDATSIAGWFKQIYACEFLYDATGEAVWPKLAINYTGKTQFLFRINKGILDISNDVDLNKYTPEDKRPIPFSNMIYFGDGLTDVPSMKLVKTGGGHAIAIYPPDELPTGIALQLAADQRVDFLAAADYGKNGALIKIITAIFNGLVAEHNISQLKLKEQENNNEHTV